jgi:hypothetical protein
MLALGGLSLAMSPAAAATSDEDGDGVSTGDCAPLDPTIHPGALDRPDPAFVDSNCDGIDGDLSKAIFVGVGGDDAATGMLTDPMRHIAAAVAKAEADHKDVYVAGGTYIESVPAADGVGIFGGYTPITGARSAATTTTIQGAPAVLAAGVAGVTLQMLTLHGMPDTAGNSYGLRAVPNGTIASQVLLDHVQVETAPGTAGASGSSGDAGTGNGFSGGAGGAGGCGNGVQGQSGGLGFNSGLPGAVGLAGATSRRPHCQML